MNVLTVPRAAAAFEYKALRLPAQLVETQLVVRFLDADSAFRLAFERALGTADAAAGRLFADASLTRRGAALRRRADVLATAVALEEKAQQRVEQADATLEAKRAQAARDLELARQAQQEKAKQVVQAQQAERDAARRRTRAKRQAAVGAVDAQASAAVEAERQRLAEEQARTAQREQARTAAPKAQLDGALAQAEAATQRRRDADRLAELAETERAARKSS